MARPIVVRQPPGGRRWAAPSPQVPTMFRTHDLLHHYRGSGPGELLCRIQVFEQPGAVPVVVVTELSRGCGPSLPKVEPYLAAEILARYLPQRFEEPEPVRWIE